MTRTVFPCGHFLATSLLLLVAAVNANDNADGRELLVGGINLCAAYDGIMPLIPDGEDHCVCDGRTLVCDFDNLNMKMDFTEEGAEYMRYETTTEDAQQLTAVLNVRPDLSEIESCTATTTSADACDCTVCNDGQGVELACGTMGGDCTAVNIATFERFVPSVGQPNAVMASLSNQETSNSGAADNHVRATTAVLAAVASFVIAMAL